MSKWHSATHCKMFYVHSQAWRWRACLLLLSLDGCTYALGCGFGLGAILMGGVIGPPSLTCGLCLHKKGNCPRGTALLCAPMDQGPGNTNMTPNPKPRQWVHVLNAGVTACDSLAGEDRDIGGSQYVGGCHCRGGSGEFHCPRILIPL